MNFFCWANCPPEVDGDNVICEVLDSRYVKVIWDMVLLEEATDNQF